MPDGYLSAPSFHIVTLAASLMKSLHPNANAWTCDPSPLTPIASMNEIHRYMIDDLPCWTALDNRLRIESHFLYLHLWNNLTTRNRLHKLLLDPYLLLPSLQTMQNKSKQYGQYRFVIQHCHGYFSICPQDIYGIGFDGWVRYCC